MSIEIITRKSFRGSYECKSNIEIGDNRILRISTYRQANGVLITSATCLKREDRGGSIVEIWAMFGDFSSTLCKSQPRRVTAAICEAQHRAVLANAAAIQAEALAFYAAKASAA